MKTFVSLVLALATTTSALAAPKHQPHLSCYRHIYNTSGGAWTFSATNNYGNLWFPTNLQSCTPKNGPCVVPPGTTIQIQYTQQAGYSSGNITITDQTGASNSFGYSNSIYDCPRIQHSGSTGAVSVNDPANGDMNAWANTWGDGKAGKPKKK